MRRAALLLLASMVLPTSVASAHPPEPSVTAVAGEGSLAAIGRLFDARDVLQGDLLVVAHAGGLAASTAGLPSAAGWFEAVVTTERGDGTPDLQAYRGPLDTDDIVIAGDRSSASLTLDLGSRGTAALEFTRAPIPAQPMLDVELGRDVDVRGDEHSWTARLTLREARHAAVSGTLGNALRVETLPFFGDPYGFISDAVAGSIRSDAGIVPLP